jgi:hypothetical protein
MMAYVGARGTRTPLHVDKAASIAFNCVAWAEDESSYKSWWLFHPDDAQVVDAHIKSVHGEASRLQDDSHWVDLDDLAALPQLTHGLTRIDQRIGELVIVPPMAPHCVVNQGGVSFAVAGNVIDRAMACEVLAVELENRDKRVKNVYKVKGAIWGVLCKCIELGKVEREIWVAAEVKRCVLL